MQRSRPDYLDTDTVDQIIRLLVAAAAFFAVMGFLAGLALGMVL